MGSVLRIANPRMTTAPNPKSTRERVPGLRGVSNPRVSVSRNRGTTFLHLEFLSILSDLSDLCVRFLVSGGNNSTSTRERVPQPRGKIQHPLHPPPHAARATCHQKAAATADKIDSSGTAQAQPRQRPVQPAPASAANNPNGLRMTCPWPPNQIQLQSPSERGQRLQPPA